MKSAYPNKYGQIFVDNGAWQDVSNATDFVNKVKASGTIGLTLNLEDLKQLKELHIIINKQGVNQRIIIRPEHW